MEQFSYVNNLIYKTDPEDENKIISGGYPMAKFIKREQNKRQQMGGSLLGITRFEHLVIPISIDSHAFETQEVPLSKKVKYHDTIDNEQFERFFDRISSKKNNSRTRKSEVVLSSKKTTRKSSK
jgi:hypothetical protein